jgi:hypothetical protein
MIRTVPQQLTEEIDMSADLTFRDYGTILVLTSNTPVGSDWIDSNIEAEDYSYIGGGIACDHRPARAIIDGAVRDGLTVEVRR